jgi:hypothetical protein
MRLYMIGKILRRQFFETARQRTAVPGGEPDFPSAAPKQTVLLTLEQKHSTRILPERKIQPLRLPIGRPGISVRERPEEQLRGNHFPVVGSKAEPVRSRKSDPAFGQSERKPRGGKEKRAGSAGGTFRFRILHPPIASSNKESINFSPSTRTGKKRRYSCEVGSGGDERWCPPKRDFQTVEERKIKVKKIAFWILAPMLLAGCAAPPPDTASPPSSTEVATAAAQSASPDAHATDVLVASKVAGLLFNVETVQRNLDADTTAMARTSLDTAALFAGLPESSVKLAAPRERPLVQIDKVPQGFLDPLPPGGAIPGEAGSCGAAAAKPEVTFQTAGGRAVTPELLQGMDLSVIPTEMVTLPSSDPESLLSLIDSLSQIQPGDPRTITAEGWNEMLWDKLAEERQPAQSLMDYQLWNASPEIERQVADLYREQLASMGVPPVVLNAYDASEKTGWYSNAAPTPADALAGMDILAQMSGSIEGTVHERRDFSIPGAGQTPLYGVQTGEGSVTWDSPDEGTLTFDVSIRLDVFDERGHAVGGTVTAEDREKGYTVEITFKADGTRAGVVKRNGETVGTLSMTVDEDQFKNYLDVETNQSEQLPQP